MDGGAGVARVRGMRFLLPLFSLVAAAVGALPPQMRTVLGPSAVEFRRCLAASAAGLGKIVAGGALVGRALNSKTAANLLQQGRPSAGLAKVAKVAPRLLPVIPAQAAAMDIGTVSGYDPNDPRYRGN